MPLLVVSGFPSSGKSTIARRFLDELRSRVLIDGTEHIVICDEDNSAYSHADYGDFKKEKENRSFLRSTIQRAMGRSTLVICDSLNYIKGFRYELFCAAKNAQTTYAVLWCNADPASCKWLDAQKESPSLGYSDTAMDELMRRYERPDGKNRWDSPLLEVAIDCSREEATPRKVALPIDELHSLLIEGKPLKANVSVQDLTPRMAPNFLSELDSVTKKVIDVLVEKQRLAVPGEKFVVIEEEDGKCALDNQKGGDAAINFTRQRSVVELNRLRAQFIRYSKTHPVDDSRRVAHLFVDFLNSCP